MANEYSLIEDLLRRIRAGQFNEPTQMGSMTGMRAQQPSWPDMNIPPEAYTETRNQKFGERAAPLNIQPPRYEEDIPMPVPRPAEFGARPVARAPMPVPRPVEAAPAMPENVSRALWAVYNETGNPADFERANAAQRMGRAEGGEVPDEYSTANPSSNYATMQPYDPTIRERIAAALMGSERPSAERRSFATGAADLVGMTPLGIPMAAQESRRSAGAGDYPGAVLNAMAVMPAARPEIAAIQTARKIAAEAPGAFGPIRGTEAYSENLKKFMGESKAPDVLYHASRHDFPVFDTKMSEFGSHFGTPEQANVISKSELYPDFFVSRHSKTQTYPVHVKIENPLRLTDFGEFSPNTVGRQLIDKGIMSWDDLDRVMQLPKKEASSELQNIVKNQGYDGVVYLNRREGVKNPLPKNMDIPENEFKILHPEASDSYIAFEPNQIKSSIGNRGTFDPNDPDITRAYGGSINRHGYATDGYVDPMGGAYEPAGEAPAPDWYNKAADVAARGVSAVAEPFMSGTAESAREGLNLMRGEPGRAPINAAWQYPLGAAGFLTSPIMGAGRAVKDVATELSGSPEIGARAGFMTEMGNPAKIGPAIAAALPMASRAAEAARAVQVARELSPLGFYSHGAEAAAALPQAKGTPEQYAAMLQKSGVKPAELEHVGFQQAFSGRPSVTREEISKHFQQKMPQVEETVLGVEKAKPPISEERYYDLADERAKRQLTPSEMEEFRSYERYKNGNYESTYQPTKFQQYTLPGGENYRELRMTLAQPYKALEPEIKALGLDVNTASPRDIERAGGSPDLVERFTAAMPNASNEFRHEHWPDVPNVLAHLRMADRTGPNGEKVLHLEEIQSDWGQAGRKQGFRAQKEKMFEDLIAKRDALPEGAERETIQRQINELGSGDVGVPTAPYVTSTQGWTDLALKRALREAAEGGYDKMVWTPGAEQAKRYPGTAESGMVGYYDKMVPTRLKELLKKLDKDAKLGVSEVNGIQVPSVPITPAMREKILSGQTAFATGGAVVKRALGVVSQSKPGRR